MSRESTAGEETRTVYRTCNLCEATCGVAIEIAGDRVVRVRGDKDDPFSRGFICPKGSTLGDLHHDPDRLQTPLVRRDGQLVEATWDEAFAEIDRRLSGIFEEHGRSSLALLLGNPIVHHLSTSLYVRPLVLSAGTPNISIALIIPLLSIRTITPSPRQSLNQSGGASSRLRSWW